MGIRELPQQHTPLRTERRSALFQEKGMYHKRGLFFLESTGVFMIVLGVMLLLAQPVDAQCGSQASSCKNCHEVQAQDPVNNDGTGWHVSHAFGDFCYICHAGNPQATAAEEAHTGMLPPLDDVAAACQTCHPDDLTDRAQVYATALNVEFGMGGGATGGSDTDGASSDDSGSGEAVTAQVVIGVPASNVLVLNDPNAVDYVQRYNEIVLGERPVNTGNIILIVLIAVLVVGGGGFVLVNEIRLASASKGVEGSYPADVIDMLPALTRLRRETRGALQKLIQTLDPHETGDESSS